MGAKISIIIPVYNSERYLKECLDSVLNQTYQNLEIVCVNDGSTDDSEAIIKSYSIKDSRIRLVNQKNSGVSESRNHGIRKATGDYLMFMDSDDWIDNDTCQFAMNVAQKKNADVVFWNYVREFENESKRKILFTEKVIVFEKKRLDELQRRFVGLYDEELRYPQNADAISPVWGKLYKRDTCIHDDTVFVNTDEIGTSEDALFNLKAFEHITRAVYIKKFFYHYRKENNSSFTKVYKPDLWKQWNALFNQLESFIDSHDKNDTYRIALNNRISLGILGLGMNILRGDKKTHILQLREILSSSRYRVAVRKLKMKWFPLHWKIFFFFAKTNNYLGVLGMLKCIQYLK